MSHHDAVRFYFYFEIELRYTIENAVVVFFFAHFVLSSIHLYVVAVLNSTYIPRISTN